MHTNINNTTEMCFQRETRDLIELAIERCYRLVGIRFIRNVLYISGLRVCVVVAVLTTDMVTD